MSMGWPNPNGDSAARGRVRRGHPEVTMTTTPWRWTGVPSRSNDSFAASSAWLAGRRGGVSATDRARAHRNVMVSHRLLSLDRAGIEDELESLPEPGSRYGLVGTIGLCLRDATISEKPLTEAAFVE